MQLHLRVCCVRQLGHASASPTSCVATGTRVARVLRPRSASPPAQCTRRPRPAPTSHSALPSASHAVRRLRHFSYTRTLLYMYLYEYRSIDEFLCGSYPLSLIFLKFSSVDSLTSSLSDATRSVQNFGEISQNLVISPPPKF